MYNRPTTARFSTAECKILLKAVKEARRSWIFVDNKLIDKIEKRLEQRIDKEETKTGAHNEDSTNAG